MSEYEPFRTQVKFVGRRDALKELIAKLLVPLDSTKSDRFELRLTIKELEQLKPRQVKLLG